MMSPSLSGNRDGSVASAGLTRCRRRSTRRANANHAERGAILHAFPIDGPVGGLDSELVVALAGQNIRGMSRTSIREHATGLPDQLVLFLRPGRLGKSAF